MREAKRIRSYQGNRHPFCCALFAKADRQEAMAVLETLDRQRIRIALPARGNRRLIRRAALVLLFLSPEAVQGRAVTAGVAQASAAGKTVLTIYLKATELTPGLSLQLGQTQAVFKYREASEADFYRKLLDAPALRSLSVTPEQKRALIWRALLWALCGGLVLLAGLNWKPIQARLPNAPLRQLGVPLDFDSVETLYVYGETPLDEYAMPGYKLFADGERDYVRLGQRLIPPGDIASLDDFALLRNLRELCLCNDPVESLSPLLSLTGLTLLDVSHDGELDLSGIGALAQLETLNLSHDHLSGLEALSELSSLRVLNLAYTDLTDLSWLQGLPSLKTVYIDAGLLAAAQALGETPFEILCLDTPVYGYAELKAALEDPAVTDVRIMNGLTIPASAELVVRPEVALTGAGLDGDFTVSNYGTVRVYGVWEMGLCTRINYGTIVVEPGGLYAGGMCENITTGLFRIEAGGRQNLERGMSFSLSGGRYENEGDVYLRDGYQLRFLGGTVVKHGVLHLFSTKDGVFQIGIDRDRFQNDGQVYYDGVLIPNDKLFEEAGD